MTLRFLIFVALIIGFAKANDSRYVDQMIESEENVDKKDEDAYESFRNSVYSATSLPKSGSLPPSPKSGYNAPPPPLATGYSTYLNGVGFGGPYGYGAGAYGRLGLLPFSSTYFNLGSPYPSVPYGYGPGVPAGLGYGPSLGYGAGYAYGNPVLGRAPYSPYSAPYLGFSGLGYRYGGAGYNSPFVRGTGVPVRAAYAGVPGPLPGAYAGVQAAVPAAYANVPPPGVPAAYASVSAPAVPGPVPPPPAYRPPLVATQGKDGSLRYTYAPAQRMAA